MQDPTFVGYPVGPVLKHFYVILPGLSEKFSFICTLSMFLEKDLIWLKKVFLPKISSNDLNQICKIRVSSSVCVCVCVCFFLGGGSPTTQVIVLSPYPCTVLPPKYWFCNFHAVFDHFVQIAPTSWPHLGNLENSVYANPLNLELYATELLYIFMLRLEKKLFA